MTFLTNFKNILHLVKNKIVFELFFKITTL